MAHQAGDVERRSASLQPRLVARQAVPVPVQLRVTEDRHAQLAEEARRCGGEGRGGESAVAQHLRGDPLPHLEGHLRIGQQRQLRVGMNVDEARRHDTGRRGL